MLYRSKCRIRELGEVFTPDKYVEDMLSLLSKNNRKIWCDEDVAFFEPCCGHGNIVIKIFEKRAEGLYTKALDSEMTSPVHYAVANSINTLWAIDIDKNNIQECRARVVTAVYKFFADKLELIDEEFLTNIRCAIKYQIYQNEALSALATDKILDFNKKRPRFKKIISVGNPPYQKPDSGFGRSAKSIYNLFVESHIDSTAIDEFVFIIPARWFGGGKGLNHFRYRMMNSGKIRNLVYFSNSSKVFLSVDINGGICLLHYDKNFNGLTNFTDGTCKERLDLSEFDIIPDDPKAYNIVRKILKTWKGKYVGDVAWSRNPFGLATNYFTKHKESLKSDRTISCLSRNKIKRQIDRSKIKKNIEHIDRWKVSVPAVAGGSKGNRRSTVPKAQIFIIPKGEISTETYSIIDTFKSKEEAENFVQYLKTDFARYLLGLRKIAQHIPKDRWNWVPYMDVTEEWSDVKLAKLFGLTDFEIAHIKAKVDEWSR